MRKRLLVEADALSLRVALTEDGTVAELYADGNLPLRVVGNIYLGKVQNVLPGMQAAFVNIGAERNAFLYTGDTDSTGLSLRPGQNIVVQVTKDPVGTKGARITTRISLAGRSLVLLPGGQGVGLSSRMEDRELRSRLKERLSAICPENCGLIARTAATEDEQALRRELQALQDLYASLCRRAEHSEAPCLLRREESLLYRTIRDLFLPDVEELVCNEEKTCAELRSLAEALTPELADRIRLDVSPEPLISALASPGAISKLLARRVFLKNGAYIVIDRTEALTAIDVNTGRFTGHGNLEQTVTETNCLAAEEVARQLRLRDIGGIIIIDFIDMESAENRELVLNTLNAALRRDRTKTTVQGFTSLGLVEMTRKKAGISLGDSLQEPCRSCLGSGVVLSKATVRNLLYRQVLLALSNAPERCLVLEVHPSLYAVLETEAKERGQLFPGAEDAVLAVCSRPGLTEPQFRIRPVSPQNIPKDCKIFR